MGNIFATKEWLVSLNYKEHREELSNPTKMGKEHKQEKTLKGSYTYSRVLNLTQNKWNANQSYSAVFFTNQMSKDQKVG